jgi:hypothetical protein
MCSGPDIYINLLRSDLEHSSSRQFPSNHQFAKFVQILKSPFRQDWMHEATSGKVQGFFNVLKRANYAAYDIQLPQT